MANTRRAMHALEGSDADSGLVQCLLDSDSKREAVLAFSALRGILDERELLMLANLREVLAEIPATPFRSGEALEILARAGSYEDTGRSFRRRFETSAGVFGLEFVGRGHECDLIAVHNPEARRPLRAADGRLEQHMLAMFVRHGILLDALLEALVLLGCPMQPAIYLSADDFLADVDRVPAPTPRLPRWRWEQPRRRVLVIGGSGVAAPLMHRLASDGWLVSSGALNQGDADQVAAEELGIEYALIRPFAPMDSRAAITTAKLAEQTDAIVVCDVPFGRGNIDNLLVAAHAGRPLVLVGDIDGRDYAGGAASSYWVEALGNGAVVVATDAGVGSALARLLGLTAT